MTAWTELPGAGEQALLLGGTDPTVGGVASTPPTVDPRPTSAEPWRAGAAEGGGR